MKTLLGFCLLTLLAHPSLWAQGTLYLANRDVRTSIDAPIYYPVGAFEVGQVLQLEMLAGRSPANLETLFSDLKMGSNGYWQPQTYTFDAFQPGETVFVQVRVFLGGPGMTYGEAQRRGLYHGAFETLPVALGGVTDGGTHPPTLPASMVGLKPLVLTGVPEPGVLPLLLLAAVGFWLPAGVRKVRRRTSCLDPRGANHRKSA